MQGDALRRHPSRVAEVLVLRTTEWLGLLLFISVSLCAPPLEGQSEPDEPPLLSLSETIELAFENSELMVEVRDSLQQAKLSVNLARSFFSPKIVPNILGALGQSNQANQTYQLTVSKRFITGTEVRANVATTSLRNQLGNFWNTDTSFSVSQPILRGFGRSVSGRELARSEARVRNTERRQILVERQLSLQVASAYYTIVSQSRMAEVAERTLERAVHLLAASEAKLQAGRVSQLDVFRAEQLAAETEGQLLDARAALEDSRDLLRDLLELGHDEDFRVDMEIPRPLDLPTPDEAATIAVENSLEIQIARDAITEAERAVAHAKNQMLPQLDLGVAAFRGKTSDRISDTFGANDYEVTTFIAASAPVDRTSETIAFNNALIDRDRRRRDLARLQRQAASNARRAARQLTRLFRTLELGESRAQFAENELEVATARYQLGFANNLDVVNAELNLLTTQSRVIAILANLAVARVQLRDAMGILNPRQDY